MIDDVAGFHGPLATQAFRSGAHAWIVARNPNSCFEVPLRSHEEAASYATVIAGRCAFQARGVRVAGSSPLARRCSTSVR